MKHRISFYLTYACVVAFGVLGVLLLALGEKKARASDAENRMLSGFPALSAQSVGDGSFMSGMESYLSDGIPARERVITETAVWMNMLSLDRTTDGLEDPELTDEEGTDYFDEEDPALVDAENPAFVDEEEPASDREATAEAAAPSESPAPESPSGEQDAPQTEQPETETPSPEPEPSASAPQESSIEACTFCEILPDGTSFAIKAYTAEEMRKTIDVINAYRAILPEDGHVFFIQAPTPKIAFDIQNGTYIGWESDVEQTIAENALPGVEVFSPADILVPHLKAGEDLYFHTDHHWKPLAACYTAQAMLGRIGIHAMDYDEYTYRHNTGFYGSKKYTHPEVLQTMEPDTIDVMIPILPVKGYTILWTGGKPNCQFLIPERNNYAGYLGGQRGPWRCYETGVDSGRRCLVTGDSYANCFLPYLAPYYEEIHAVDFREDNYDGEHRRWTVRQYVEEHEIDDIYIVISMSTGISHVIMQKLMQRYL